MDTSHVSGFTFGYFRKRRNNDNFTVIGRELECMYLYGVMQPMMHFNKPNFTTIFTKKRVALGQ